MARAALLDTKTQTFLELIGNGKRYRVPPYQRDYSWGPEQWEDLWSDVADLLDRPEDRHYMGALVVEAVDDREFKVIDGQQRLATLTILALVAIRHLQGLAHDGIDADANAERARAVRSRFVGEKDPASLVEVSKLALNETDDAFFQDYLVQLRDHPNHRALPVSNRLLADCFRWFADRLRQLPFAADGRAVAAMISDHVARQLLFIQITVDDELNAYTVFETLNARGLELTVTDLLKNYFFSRIRVGADLQAMHRRWKALAGVVRHERFPDFLRYHLLCEVPKVRTARLFKLVRERIHDAVDVFRLMDVLQSRAEIYAALNDVNHEYWVENAEARRHVRELNLFRAKQMTPLLMAAWEKFDAVEYTRLLKLVSVITFRYTVVSSLNSNDLEPAYHAAARAVATGQATGARDVFELLRNIYVEDDVMQQNFERLDIQTTGQRRQLVKYILCRLESDASGIERSAETDPGTIEHVLPENAGAEWEAEFPRELWDRFVYRLGNLTLLEAGMNPDLGNQGFAAKAARYAHSQYQLSVQIPQIAPEHWNPDMVARRQELLARRAVHIWRAAFV